MHRHDAPETPRRRIYSLGAVCLAGLIAASVWPLSAQPIPPPTGGQVVYGPRRQVGPSMVEAVTARVKADLRKPATVAAKEPASSKSSGTAATPTGADDAKPDSGGAIDDSADDAAARHAAAGISPPAPTGKGRAKNLEVEAQQCKEAGEALQLYKVFLAEATATAEEKELARQRMEFWEQAARDDLVRVGKKWYSKAAAKRLKEEADKLVAEAIVLLDVKSYKKADEKLEKASRVYPDHLESLFLLGVGAFLTDDVKGADKRFAQCLSRAPNHVPLLNNVAICCVLTKKFDRAVKHWEKAAAVEPDNPVIAQNVGQFLADAETAKTQAKANKGKPKVKGQIEFGSVDRRVIDDAADLYSKLVSKGKTTAANTSGGYYLMKLWQPKKGDKTDRSTPEDIQIVGNGSGFVIWEGYVLTNKHVVDDADGVVIQDPGNPTGEPLAGKVVAVSKDLDLAIVQCLPLMAPAAPVNASIVTRGTEVLALGFPVMNVVGRGLKATRGIITGLPSKDTGNLMVLDVQVNPGNSGGPLCDKSGRVMGIVAAKTFTERFVQGYGLAIPMGDALAFIRQRIPGFSEAQPTDKKQEWTEVDAQISKSTVLVLIKKKKRP